MIFKKKKFGAKQKIKKIHKRLSKDINDPVLEDLNSLQKKAASCQDKRIIVLAGAGAGKTKTLTQRILYLISKGVDPGNILAITFTKNAANEMIDRLIIASDKTEEYKNIINNKRVSGKEKAQYRYNYINKYPWLSNITIKTFHSFCYQLLRKHNEEFDSKFRIIPKNDFSLTEDDFVTTKNSAPEKTEDILNKIIKILSNNPTYLIDFKTYILEFYHDDKRLKRYMAYTNYQKPYTTLNGTQVRSKSERSIADWLYLHNIKFVYEPVINFADFPFKPDFYIPEADIYIEHVSNLSYATKDKEEQFSKSGKILYKTYEPMTKDIKKFHDALARMIIPRLDKNIDEEVALKYETELQGYHDYVKEFIDLTVKVIDKIKVEDLDFKKIFQKGIKDEYERVNRYYKLAEPLILEYLTYCNNKSYLDFNDLLNKGKNLLEKNSKIRKYYQEKFKHILVDEFQDVNTAQVNLLYTLLNNNYLFCVGDDWQSIYGFRGSEVSYIVRFSDYFKHPTIIKLSTNYRSNNTIVCASNEVIKKNKFKLDKKIEAHKKNNTKIYVYYSQKESEDGVQVVVNKVKSLLANGFEKSDILILYRKSKAFEPYYYRFKEERIYVPSKTIHKAKGLEAKIVFIVGLNAGIHGFPSIYDEDRIFQIIKKNDFELLMEEERRVFYVALTRAKDELFLVTETGSESEFIKEIPNEYLDKENFVILNFKPEKPEICIKCKKEIDKKFSYCPFCGNILIVKNEIKENNIQKQNTDDEYLDLTNEINKSYKEEKHLAYQPENRNNIIQKENNQKLDEIRKIYPKAYASWTEEEDNQLINEFKQNLTMEKIAVIHERKKGAITARLLKLGLIEKLN